ncbi:MAG: porin family protein [Opitutaceae bacterium]|nr:porin family protein [Opitutaceae bacterium]
MKTKTLLGAAGALLLSASVASAAGGFIRGQVIYADFDDAGYDADWGYGIVGGSYLDVTQKHEVSLEADWIRWDVSATGEGLTGDAKHRFLPILANYRYHFRTPDVSRISFYLGASVGYAQSKIEGSVREDLGEFIDSFEDSDWGFVYGGTVGVTYEVNRAWSLDVGYRLLMANENDFDEPIGSIDDATINMGYVGIGWKF